VNFRLLLKAAIASVANVADALVNYVKNNPNDPLNIEADSISASK
jgi:hypothetical protein